MLTVAATNYLKIKKSMKQMENNLDFELYKYEIGIIIEFK